VRVRQAAGNVFDQDTDPIRRLRKRMISNSIRKNQIKNKTLDLTVA
jgi:hypothetical protein